MIILDKKHTTKLISNDISVLVKWQGNEFFFSNKTEPDFVISKLGKPNEKKYVTKSFVLKYKCKYEDCNCFYQFYFSDNSLVKFVNWFSHKIS